MTVPTIRAKIEYRWDESVWQTAIFRPTGSAAALLSWTSALKRYKKSFTAIKYLIGYNILIAYPINYQACVG